MQELEKFIIPMSLIGVAFFAGGVITCQCIILLNEELRSRTRISLLPCVLLVITWTTCILIATIAIQEVVTHGSKPTKALPENSGCLNEEK